MKRDKSQIELEFNEYKNRGNPEISKKIQEYDERTWSHMKNFNSEQNFELYRKDDEISEGEIERCYKEAEEIEAEREAKKNSLESKFEMPEKKREIKINLTRDLKDAVSKWGRKGNFYVGFDFYEKYSRGDSGNVDRKYVFPNGDFYVVNSFFEKGDNQIEQMSINFDNVFGDDYNLTFFREGVHVSNKD